MRVFRIWFHLNDNAGFQMLALVLQVEEHLEHQPLARTIILEASLGVHRQNQVLLCSGSSGMQP